MAATVLCQLKGPINKELGRIAWRWEEWRLIGKNGTRMERIFTDFLSAFIRQIRVIRVLLFTFRGWNELQNLLHVTMILRR